MTRSASIAKQALDHGIKAKYVNTCVKVHPHDTIVILVMQLFEGAETQNYCLWFDGEWEDFSTSRLIDFSKHSILPLGLCLQ